MQELARGVAFAAGETARLSEAQVASWLEARLAADACEIGHTDLLATPQAGR